MSKPNLSDEVSYQIQLIEVKRNCLFLVSSISICFVTSDGDQKPNLKYQINVLSFYRSKLFFGSDQKQLFSTKFHILNHFQCPGFRPIERKTRQYVPSVG